ncbi:MAG: hypothetical protein Q8P53_02360 [Candidatus Shapirobacteria bacterium]|nr:hypothetical protein [Candidatus Shapirobacteria bacterium]
MNQVSKEVVYLIGINHDIQLNKDCNLSKQFLNTLENLILDFDIRFVFEEWSVDVNKIWKVKSSTIKRLVDKMKKELKNNIDHSYCDPELHERINENIKDENDLKKEHGWIGLLTPEQRMIIDCEMWKEYEKREKIWLKKIVDKIKDKNVVFICGTKHISIFNTLRGEGFDTLLTKSGYIIKVIPERFDKWYK